MHPWYSTELLLSLLLISTYMCVGMLTIWALASPRHWFTKTCVVFLCLSTLLFAPAYELCFTFAIAIALTHLFVRGANWVRMRRELKSSRLPPESRPPRFSILSALLITAVVAAVLAVLCHVPAIVWSLWPAWTIGGTVLAFAYLLTWWSANRNIRRWQQLVMFSFATVMAGVLFTVLGAIMLGLFSGALLLGYDPNTLGAIYWCVAALVAESLLYFTLILSKLSHSQLAQQISNDQRVSAPRVLQPRRIALMALLIICAAPLVVTDWELAHPLPILSEQIPNPNSIELLDNLASKLTNSQTTKLGDADSIDFDRLTSAVASEQANFDEINHLIAMPGWISVRYDDHYFDDMNFLTNRRRIARFMEAKCKTEIHAQKMDDAINTESAMLKAAELFHHGGLAIDFLIATACESMCQYEIYKSVDLLDKPQCQRLLQELMSSDARDRGLRGALYREHIFMQRNTRWVGHIVEFLGRISNNLSNNWRVDSEVRWAHDRTRAVGRMLILKLALRAYQLDHGAPPTSLTPLVPAYLPAIPLDPLDPSNQPLRYKIAGATYSLYSVGRDRVDDGGHPVAKDSQAPIPTGDLLLDVEMAAQDPYPADNSAATNFPATEIDDPAPPAE